MNWFRKRRFDIHLWLDILLYSAAVAVIAGITFLCIGLTQ